MRGPTARFFQRALVLVLVWGTCGSPGLAQNVAYTVQVVALSDREAALGIQTDLLRQGFPAYVVRSTSTQGDVFRVRVGAFADRASTLLYASGMPAVGGGEPVPALAEGIPVGITPLAPSLLLEHADPSAAEVYESGELLVLRLAADEGPAEYVIVDGLSVTRHSAYLLGEVDGARLWVRETLVWPATWREEPDAVREGFMSSLLGLLSERLGVPVEQVEDAVYRPSEDVAPRIIVVELEAPEEPDGLRLLGIGLPEEGIGPYGPAQYLGVDAEFLPRPPEPVSLETLVKEPPESVEAEGFVAVPDDDYSLIEASGRTWRAVLGTPLWTDGDHLLAEWDGRLLVYGFVAR